MCSFSSLFPFLIALYSSNKIVKLLLEDHTAILVPHLEKVRWQLIPFQQLLKTRAQFQVDRTPEVGLVIVA